MPPALPISRWPATSGDSELVLYDSGELKLHHDGLEYVIASPWVKAASTVPPEAADTIPPPSGVVDSEPPDEDG